LLVAEVELRVLLLVVEEEVPEVLELLLDFP
jgi:hypothetical protein